MVVSQAAGRGKSLEVFKLPGLVGPPVLPDASSVPEFFLWYLPLLSLQLSSIFSGSQSSLLVGRQSPVSSIFFSLCLQLPSHSS